MSPKFHDVSGEVESEHEVCRSVAVVNNSCFMFSFGKKKLVSPESVRNSPIHNRDDAFLCGSFSKDCKISEAAQAVEREDFELGLIINQIQR